MSSALYIPARPEATPTFRFLSTVNATFHLELASYQDLYKWSTAHIDHFWGLVWDQTNVVGHKGSHVVDNAALPPTNPTWFGSPLHLPPPVPYPRCSPGSPRQGSTGLRICCNVVLIINSLSSKPVRHSQFPSPASFLIRKISRAYPGQPLPRVAPMHLFSVIFPSR